MWSGPQGITLWFTGLGDMLRRLSPYIHPLSDFHAPGVGLSLSSDIILALVLWIEDAPRGGGRIGGLYPSLLYQKPGVWNVSYRGFVEGRGFIQG